MSRVARTLKALLAVAIGLVCVPAQGQYGTPRETSIDRGQVGLELGYIFGYDVDTVAGEVGFDGGLGYGLEGSFRIPSQTLLVANYLWLPTELTLDRFMGPTRHLSDLDLHFFQFGAQREFLRGPLRPFASFTVGATLFAADAYDDEWKFSAVLSGGLKYLPTPQYGIRAQMRLFNSFATTNSAVFCSFSGCDYGVTGGGILHVGLTGMLFWVF